AFAANLSTGVTTDNIMYVTGATAQTRGLAIALGKLCGANTFISLTDGTALPVAKGYKCDAPATATFTALPGVTGPWVVLKNEGGSLNAITPLRNGSNQNQLDITNCTVTGATGTCTNALVAKPEYFGFSDVSQKVFAAKNQLVAQIAGNTYTADISVGAGQGFGIVVSPALYTLLQADQGTSGIPSISKAQYASLMTQTAGTWGTLLPNGTAHAASTTVTLARRSLTSGTQAASEVFFLSNPCAGGSAPIGGSSAAVLGTSAGQNFGEIIVKQEGSSDAVLAEMTATPYAIGVVSLENIQPASSWKFVAIDGVHPGAANAPDWQRANVVNGKYGFAFETFLQKSTKPTISAAILNNINDFTNAIIADLGVGANLATSNGLFGDPLATNADLGVETNHYSRSGNECGVLANQF
ncbi:MAG: hypothetical protein H7Z18_04670, partial [Methylophilaceae bacterium]|nr:hypothetical protein [Methylophilaceae bacterium]